MLEQLTDGIYRICIPFERIYTTSFVLTHEGKTMVADTGSCQEDVEAYILPALEALGVKPDYIVISHFHWDHSGGLQAIMEAFPDATIGTFSGERNGGRYHHFVDGEVLFHRFQMLHLPGHSEDSLGIYDLKIKALLSFDCLQKFGLDRFGTGVWDYATYRKTIQRVRRLAPIEIIAAHDYVPDGYRAIGADDVEVFLANCEASVNKISSFGKMRRHLAWDEISRLYIMENPELPPIGGGGFLAASKEWES